MCGTCDYHDPMAKMVQLRNVPDDLHRKLKARAAMAGMSLTDYLLREVRNIAEKPTMEEMMKRLAEAEPVIAKLSPAEILREEREKSSARRRPSSVMTRAAGKRSSPSKSSPE